MKIKVWAQDLPSGMNYEDVWDIDDEEWEDLTDKEREELLDEMALEHLTSHVDYGATPTK